MRSIAPRPTPKKETVANRKLPTIIISEPIPAGGGVISYEQSNTIDTK